jgi:SAM-dependent methyltransferase
VETLALGGDDLVVDVGAGTGKFTRELVSRGLRVTAVEPLAGMRAVLERELPQVEALAGTAEDLPLPDGVAAAVTVAQAFHWFDEGRAMPELRRVLRPEGGVALVWNVRDQSHAIHRAYAETIRPYRGGDYPEMQSHARFFADSELFTPYVEREFAHVQLMDADGLVARAASVSFIAALPDDERAALLERVRALAPDGTFEFPYVTKVFTCRRR